MLTQRPDLFSAIVSRSPLLDMRRYHVLLAGASWMSEYGDPDQPFDWSYIARYSPYHSIRKDVRYPKALTTTPTRDDRVHPSHARKMAARMSQAGHEVLYYELENCGSAWTRRWWHAGSPWFTGTVAHVAHEMSLIPVQPASPPRY